METSEIKKILREKLTENEYDALTELVKNNNDESFEAKFKLLVTKEEFNSYKLEIKDEFKEVRKEIRAGNDKIFWTIVIAIFLLFIRSLIPL